VHLACAELSQVDADLLTIHIPHVVVHQMLLRDEVGRLILALDQLAADGLLPMLEIVVQTHTTPTRKNDVVAAPHPTAQLGLAAPREQSVQKVREAVLLEPARNWLGHRLLHPSQELEPREHGADQTENREHDDECRTDIKNPRAVQVRPPSSTTTPRRIVPPFQPRW